LQCPDCGGPLWTIGDEGTRRYRCYLGHAMSARLLVTDQRDRVEAALWNAVRALHDRAATFATLAADARRIGKAQLAADHDASARAAERDVEVAREFMLELTRR